LGRPKVRKKEEKPMRREDGKWKRPKVGKKESKLQPYDQGEEDSFNIEHIQLRKKYSIFNQIIELPI